MQELHPAVDKDAIDGNAQRRTAKMPLLWSAVPRAGVQCSHGTVQRARGAVLEFVVQNDRQAEGLEGTYGAVRDHTHDCLHKMRKIDFG